MEGRGGRHGEEPTHEQLFQCLICLDRAQDAQLLRCCVKIVCRECVHRWLQNRRQCPHCREPLTQAQLTNCPFVDETYEELDKLRTQLDAQKTQCCDEHGLPFSYFCNTCSTAVCSDCAIFANSHKGHDFQKIDDVYDAQKLKVQDGMADVRARLIDLQVLESEVERNIHEVNKEKEQVAAELNTAFDGVMARLDGHLSSKLVVLARQKEEIAVDYKKTVAVMTQVEEELLKSSAADLIAKGPQLLSATQDVCRKPANEIASAIVPHEDFVCELVPLYESGSFTLRRYSALREAALGEATEALYSHQLESSSGLVWRLKVYPNGNGVARDQYLSVFVELTDAPEHDTDESGSSRPHATYEYRIEMLNAAEPDQPPMVREYASEFEVGECWGYNRFFRIDDLVDQGFLQPEQDTITITFHVRAQTYFQHSADQAACIKHLRKMAREAAGAEARRGRAARKDALNSSRPGGSPGKSPHKREELSPGKSVRQGAGAQSTDGAAAEPEPEPEPEPEMEPEPEPEPNFKTNDQTETETATDTELQLTSEPAPTPESEPEQASDEVCSDGGSSRMASLLQDNLEVDEGAVADDDSALLSDLDLDDSGSERPDPAAHSLLDAPDQLRRTVEGRDRGRGRDRDRETARVHLRQIMAEVAASSAAECTRSLGCTCPLCDMSAPAIAPIRSTAPSSTGEADDDHSFLLDLDASSDLSLDGNNAGWRPHPANSSPGGLPNQQQRSTVDAAAHTSRPASEDPAEPPSTPASAGNHQPRPVAGSQHDTAGSAAARENHPAPTPVLSHSPGSSLRPSRNGSGGSGAAKSRFRPPTRQPPAPPTTTPRQDTGSNSADMRTVGERHGDLSPNRAHSQSKRRTDAPRQASRQWSVGSQPELEREPAIELLSSSQRDWLRQRARAHEETQRQFLTTTTLTSPADLMLDSSLGNSSSDAVGGGGADAAAPTTAVAAIPAAQAGYAGESVPTASDHDAADDESALAIDWPGASYVEPLHSASIRHSGSQSERAPSTDGCATVRPGSYGDSGNGVRAPSPPPQPTPEHSRDGSARWSSSRRLHMNVVSNGPTAAPQSVPVGLSSPQQRDLFLEEAPADEVELRVEEVNWDGDDDEQFHDA